MVGSFKFTLQPESVNYNHLGGALLNAVKVLKKQHYFGKTGSRSTTTSRSTELFFFPRGNHVPFFLKQLLSRLSVWVRDDMLCAGAKVVSIFFVQHKMFAFFNIYSQKKIIDVYLYFT